MLRRWFHPRANLSVAMRVYLIHARLLLFEGLALLA